MAIFAGLFGLGRGGGNSSSSEQLNNQQLQLTETLKKLADYGIPAGKANFEKAGAAYDTSLDFYNKILTGDNDELLNLINADEYTKSADQAEAAAYNLAGRSGSRAAALAGVSETRAGNLNRMLTALRANAPAEIANIAQAVANMGAQQLTAGTGGLTSASNTLFGLSQLRQQEADRRTKLISSIIGTAGSIAGAVAGASDSNLKENIKPVREIINKLRNVYGYSFDWNIKAIAVGKDPGSKEAGILAEQVGSVFPELVSVDSAGYKRVNYMTLTALLTESLQELYTENENLKAALVGA